MSEQKLRVADDLIVSLEYILQLDDGEEIDRSDSQDPLAFLQGHGQIIPGLEQALYGMGVGEKKKVIIAPAEGYGEYDPKDFETMPRNAFPADLELSEGMALQLRDSDTNQMYEAYVSEVQPEKVVLDFNHPLAGETLHFNVKIAGLRAATAEELAHGHVHDAENGH